MQARNKVGKLISLFKEKNKYVVGVQGTSVWFSFNNKSDAINKLNELKLGEYR